MTFDPRWDAVHRDRQWATNPCEHLCRFVVTNYPGERTGLRALDLGCGAGAQTVYLGIEGFAVDGIDGSAAAIDRCALRAWDITPTCRCSFHIADMTAIPFPANEFDLVVDVASLQCLDHADAANALAEAHRVLKPGGRLFSYSSRIGTSPEVHRGMPVRSMSFPEIIRLYSVTVPFQIESVDHASHSLKNGEVHVRHWIIVARKAK